MDGFVVKVNNQDVTLDTAEDAVQELPMTFAERFLHIITNPTIAFILLTLGVNALLFELSSPGGYAAGVVGILCLLFAFYALGVLPVNYAGLLLIGLAFVLFVVDVKAPTHGVLTAALPRHRRRPDPLQLAAVPGLNQRRHHRGALTGLAFAIPRRRPKKARGHRP
jgi:membrane-bound serine protease (ClpP class)